MFSKWLIAEVHSLFQHFLWWWTVDRVSAGGFGKRSLLGNFHYISGQYIQAHKSPLTRCGTLRGSISLVIITAGQYIETRHGVSLQTGRYVSTTIIGLVRYEHPRIYQKFEADN
ncbi:hypothetical protein BDD12DRAFT_112597 [Trichophaea hybrida]|nr:hypothetical protein BDD12DRAFT_112597 [Trichophaea hybrida]